MVTAKAAFNDGLRSVVTPSLRARGYTGTSGRYYLTGPEHTGSVLVAGNPKRSGLECFVYDVHIGVTSSYLRRTSELRGSPVPARPTVWSGHDWFDHLHEGRYEMGEDPIKHAESLLSILELGACQVIEASLTNVALRKMVDTNPVGVGRGWARLLMDIEEGLLDAAAPRLDTAAAERGEDDPLVTELRRVYGAQVVQSET